MKRIISILLIVFISFQCVGCSVADKAKNLASNAKNNVVEWYANIDTSKFKKGWQSVSSTIASAYSVAVSSQFATKVANAIQEFNTTINTTYRSAGNLAQEAGYLAEKWVAGTFNVNAVANNSVESAWTNNSNGLGSADVTSSFGEEVSLKYYKSADGSAQAQATAFIKAYKEYASGTDNPLSLKEYADQKGFDSTTQKGLLSSIYEGQTRIIPTDQIDDAIKYLEGKIDKLSSVEGQATAAMTENYQETLSRLKDRLTAPDGTESTPITYEELQAAAELAKDGKFDYRKLGIKPSQIIPPKYILKQAVGTGLTAGLISAALTIGPDLLSVLIDAAKNGGFDEDRLNQVGIDGLLSASEGFVEGSLSSAITVMCQGGYFGSALENAEPSVVATLTILTIDAIRYGYYLAKGEISAEDYGNLMAERTIIAAITLPSAYALTALLGGTQLAGIAGCLAGSVIAVAGFTVFKNIALKIKDGGGFAAIIPVGIVNTIDVAKETVASLNIKEQFSSLKDFVLTTTNDGLIYIKSSLS